MTTTQLEAPVMTVRPFARIGADTRYVLTGFPIGIAALTVSVTAFSLGLGLAVVWVGVPILVAALVAARGFAAAERRRAGAVLGQDLEDPVYRTGPALHRLADPRAWRDLAHAMVRFIPNTIAFSFVVAWWAGLLGGLTWAAWGWALPNGPDDHDVTYWLGLGESYGTSVVFYLVTAVVFGATLPLVVRAAARLEAGFARALLGSRPR
ncbi:sensor domain-containing protein [Actinoplanes sp. NPDC048796]|uniref:sensor domain-containing protein n=1 Tax=Actinoplanes sp. NPDC048796 TaxID=3155640 RepID=UPI00340AAA60